MNYPTTRSELRELRPLHNALSSDLVVGYLDDVSGGGDSSTVAHDVAMVESLGSEIGLSINRSKCELISDSFPDILPSGFQISAPERCRSSGCPSHGWCSHGFSPQGEMRGPPKGLGSDVIHFLK